MLLVVENLHLSFTSSDLWTLFAPFGKVLWTRLVKDTNGETLSFGYVEFSSNEAAVEAMSALHGTTVLEQLIRVGVSGDLIQRRKRV